MKVTVKMSIDLHTIEVKDEKEIIEALEKYRTRHFKTLTIDLMAMDVKSITIMKFTDRLYVNMFYGPVLEEGYSEEIYDAKDFDEIINKAKTFFGIENENKQ